MPALTANRCVSSASAPEFTAHARQRGTAGDQQSHAIAMDRRDPANATKALGRSWLAIALSNGRQETEIPINMMRITGPFATRIPLTTACFAVNIECCLCYSKRYLTLPLRIEGGHPVLNQ